MSDRQKWHISGFALECHPGQFRCSDGSCIGRKHICNGVSDCVDGSDEAPKADCRPRAVGGSGAGASCIDADGGNPCDHLCLKSETGFRCGCQSGYELLDDGQKCKG